MRIVQSADRYQVLGLNRHSARLFEGNRDSIDEITLAPEVPRSLDEVVEREQERDRASRTHGRVEPGAMGRHGASDSKRSEEHTSELQSLMRISYAVFCLTKKTLTHTNTTKIST